MTPKHVTEILHKAVAEWATDHVSWPRRMYLGTAEWKQLNGHLVYLAAKEPTFTVDSAKRTQWEGMDVYRVDAENHIGFG